MNKSTIPPDDPRLTAYALGELEGGELAEVEAALRADPAAQSAVAEIRIAAGQLTDALAGETVEAAAMQRGNERMASRCRWLGVSRARWIGSLSVGGLIAACLAVLFVHETNRPPVRDSDKIASFSAFGLSAVANSTVKKHEGAMALAARRPSALAMASAELTAERAAKREAHPAPVSSPSVAKAAFAGNRIGASLFDPSKSLLEQSNASVPTRSQTGAFAAVAPGGNATAAAQPSPPIRNLTPVSGGITNLAVKAEEAKASLAPEASGDIPLAMKNNAGGIAAAGFGNPQEIGGETNPRVYTYPPDNGFTIIAKPASPDNGFAIIAKPAPAKNEFKSAVTIEVDQGGAISFNRKAVSKQQLVALLKHVAQTDPDTPVLIKAHELSQIKTLVFIMEACREAHLNKFSLQSR